MLFTLVPGEDRNRPQGPFMTRSAPRGLAGPPWPTPSTGAAPAPQAVGPMPVDHSEVGRSVPFQYFWRVRLPELDCGTRMIVWRVKIHCATFRNATLGAP